MLFEMERAELNLEHGQEEKEEEEEEDTSLQVRKSRSVNGNSQNTEISILDSDGSTSGSDAKSSVVTSNGANHFESTFENEPKFEDPGWVIDDRGLLTNRHKKEENLVFYDKNAGIWKCRICSWIYQNGSFCVDHVQNHKAQLHKPMNDKTLENETKGVEFSPTYIGEQVIEVVNKDNKHEVLSQYFVELHNSAGIINKASEGHLEDDSLSNSKLQSIGITKDDGLFSSNLEPSQISVPVHRISHEPSKNTESKDIYLISGDEMNVIELDVERVLQNQTTHELYCPNCNSCITRKVILRKRKRSIRVSEEDIKRNKVEAAADSKLDAGSFQASNEQIYPMDDVSVGGSLTVTKNDLEHGGEPDVFRCLSCFSLFIPTGNGFKLFKIFGEEKVDLNVHDEQVVSTKKNWLASMFGLDKQDKSVEQGSSTLADVRDSVSEIVQSSNMVDQNGQLSFVQEAVSTSQASDRFFLTDENDDTLERREKQSPIPRKGHPLNSKVLIGALADKTTENVDKGDTVKHFEVYASEQLKESKIGEEAESNHKTDLSIKTLPKRTQITVGESAEDGISISQQGGLKFLISSNEELLTVERPEEAPISHQKIEISTDGEVIQLLSTPVSVNGDVDARMGISLAVPHDNQPIQALLLTESKVENRKENLQSTDNEVVSQHISTKTQLEVHTGQPLKIGNITSVIGASTMQGTPGKDTIITVDARPVGLSQQGIIISAERERSLHSTMLVRVAEHERLEVRNEFEVEVIKSIVYGGLIKSITSLGVISSAAGGDAATLNILALGMANVIGGLFIIFHSLWELRSDCMDQISSEASPATEQKDRYKELLGRRENFKLHAIVSILSYLISGLLPVIVYGFSFCASDNKESKLLMVSVTSLLCIVALAIGRAYVRRAPKPYLKSVATFVILGILVSGVSYVAGILVERMLEKLGLFRSFNLLLPEMGRVWTSD